MNGIDIRLEGLIKNDIPTSIYASTQGKEFVLVGSSKRVLSNTIFLCAYQIVEQHNVFMIEELLVLQVPFKP